MTDHAIKVIQKNGDEDFLCDGMGNTPTRFPSYEAAMRQYEFLKIGLKGDVQSINVVKYPKKARGA